MIRESVFDFSIAKFVFKMADDQLSQNSEPRQGEQDECNREV